MSFDFKSFDYKSMETMRLGIPKKIQRFEAENLDQLIEMIKLRIPVDSRNLKVEVQFTLAELRQMEPKTIPATPAVKDLPMEQDPSRTLATWYTAGEAVADAYKQMSLNVNTDTSEQDLRNMLFEFQEEMVTLLEDYLWLMMSRADLFAVEQMNRLDPAYHFNAQWMPADDALLQQLIGDTRQYLGGWSIDIQASFVKTLHDGAGLPVEELGRQVSDMLDTKTHRGRMIAHSQLMKAFNHMALRRYENAGFEAIWLTALDLKVCPLCESKHGRPISEVGIPPEDSHPDCRCVAVPRKKETEE